MLTEIRTRIYSRGDSCSSMLSTASAKMPDGRQRIYPRGDSCSSMSSNTTNTTAVGSLLSASTNSSCSVSDYAMSKNRKRVAIEHDGQAENRKRFDNGVPSMENNTNTCTELRKTPQIGDSISMSSKDQSTSSSSKDAGDSNAATRPRRRSHRPRGCRGGRKNRKRNQLKQERSSSPIPNEIGGAEKPPVSHTSPLKSPTAPKEYSVASILLQKANSPSQNHTHSGKQQALGYSSLKPNVYAPSAHMNPNALTNMNIPPLHVFNSRAAIPVMPKTESSSYTSTTDPPPFELTYSLSADSSSSSRSGNDSNPELLTGSSSTFDEILPPPPPPTSDSRGQPLKMTGPNPYALTSTGQTSSLPSTNGANGASILRPSTKEFYPASSVPAKHSHRQHHVSHGTTRVSQMQSQSGISYGPSTALEAIYYHKSVSIYYTQQHATGNNNMLRSHATTQGSCSGQAAAAMGSSFEDSLFAISPRSFLTGAKSNPASFAW